MTALTAVRSAATTTWGGRLVALTGLLLLVTAPGSGIAVTEEVLVPLDGRGVSIAVAVVQLAGFLVLAIGLRGERGIADRSVVGTAALAVLGASPLLLALLQLVPVGLEGPLPPRLLLGSALQLVDPVAAGVAAVAVVRARVLHGVATWALSVIACGEVVALVLQLVPAAWVVLPLEVWSSVVHPLLLVALGVACVLRSVRRRSRRTPAGSPSGRGRPRRAGPGLARPSGRRPPPRSR